MGFEKKMDLNDLANVAGGKNSKKINQTAVNEQQLYKTFEEVWESKGGTASGHTRHEMDILFDEWASTDFKGTAVDFLNSKYPSAII
ncbi:MAG: hypothetical protein K5888_10900 [Lachnospiraceae bacterium]|nr:hypothetical protein [Lachnospiraceae bacterium]